MPPKSTPGKGKKTKAEEALDFLSNLDNLDVDAPAAPPAPASPAPATSSDVPASSVPAAVTNTSAEPRASIDSTRSRKLTTSGDAPDVPSSTGTPQPTAAEDEEAQKALAFLEAQINTKRAPLSVPSASAPRAAAAPSPLSGGATDPKAAGELLNEPTSAGAGGGGWGGGWWGAATSAIQSAQKMADEGYKKVRAEGAQGLEGLGVKVDLDSLRKGAEERLAGITKGVDLDKLRHDLVSTTQSTLTNLLNTVAPPISAHETLELWLAHPMIGYAGVEGVIYRAWTRVLEQTESGELVVVWSPAEGQASEERGMYPVEGWEEGWKKATEGLEGLKGREEANPRGRVKKNPDVPVTTIPIFLHLQPVLAPLTVPEPPILTLESSTSSAPPKHLFFVLSLLDTTHSLRFTTISQPSPGDWLQVPYEKSDWVEERLVDVLQTGTEILAQDYVATRMGLKSQPASVPKESLASEAAFKPVPADARVSQDADRKKD